MTDTTAQHLREDYLARLEVALRGVPHGVASDISDGIAEELQGLDAVATAERIAQLGSPADIAREAGEESRVDTAVGAAMPAAEVVRRPVVATRGYAIVSALSLGFGGFVVPVVGWFVGAVLVSSSTLWKVWEKVVAIVTPVVFVAAFLVIMQVMSLGAVVETGGSSGSGAGVEVANPLVPALSGWHAVILLGFLLVPASGLWLLWRLRGRTER